MLKIKCVLFIFFVLICNGVFAASIITQQPSEMLIYNLPPEFPHNWKEISRQVSEQTGFVEYIPVHEQAENWTMLLTIQYYDISTSNINQTIEEFADSFREETLSKFPAKIVSWKVLESTGSDVIFEWSLNKSFKGIPPQTDISKLILTKTGLHRIGINFKNRKMTPIEKKAWLQSFQKSVSIVSSAEAKRNPGLSLAEKLSGAIEYGMGFNEWTVVNNFQFDNGIVMSSRMAPGENKEYVTECLEVTTIPILKESKLNKLLDFFFESDKKIAQEKHAKKLEFMTIKRSPLEIIYSYVYPLDDLQVTAIVRSFVTDRGYYSFTYKHGLPMHCQKMKS